MPLTLDLQNGTIQGVPLTTVRVFLRDLDHLFLDETAQSTMNPDTLIYESQVFHAVPPGTIGGLFWGTTTIQPGTVGDEYFMTRGHFHAQRDCGEFYLTLRGEGILLLMSPDRQMRTAAMQAGTLHYIPGETAHRVANTGAEELVFTACWPSDAGHDYDRLACSGFASRLRRVSGRPILVSKSEI